MRKIYPLVFFMFALSAVYSQNKVCYLEPCTEAKYVNINTSIIIGLEAPMQSNENDLAGSIEVSGSASMIHPGKVTLTGDKMKIIFKPFFPFRYNETVTVKLSEKSFTASSRVKNTYSFYTELQKTVSPITGSDITRGILNSIPDEFTSRNSNSISEFPVVPQLNVSVYQNPAQGKIFAAPWYSTYAVTINNNNGSTFWYREFGFLMADFKVQPNGRCTYYDLYQNKHMELGENYEIVNTYYCGNGYFADLHELKVLNNGHAFVMAYDPQIVDMSLIVPGGNPNATVTGLIIQEIDENKNVVFQWRSWDHFLITDATHENLLGSYIDYVHGNAIEVDNDGNILISSRNLDEITKINRATGEIIWRMGGKNNQFTFINDPVGFSHQHDIRRISNGHITLFDNGNYHTPPFSRVVEYAVDELNKTATLVWKYRNIPDIYASWGGNAQRLENGNTFIGWGGASTSMTEVTPAGQIVFAASYPAGINSYRAFKFNTDLTNINIQAGNIPESYRLEQNYPNPFNPSTKISFSISEKGVVSLKVYDVSGKEVSEPVNGFRPAGNYSIDFNAEGLPSGIYFYTLRAAGFTQTKKMIFIK